MNLIKAALAALILVLLPIQPAAAADWRWHVERVCVERHMSQYWGVDNAIHQWNSVDAGQPKFYFRVDCPYWNSVTVRTVWRPDAWYGGLASIKLNSSGSIGHVDIFLNNARSQNSLLYYRNRYRRYLSAHEFGHALGLPHNNHMGSVMSYRTNPYNNNGELHWVDRRNIHLKY